MRLFLLVLIGLAVFFSLVLLFISGGWRFLHLQGPARFEHQPARRGGMRWSLCNGMVFPAGTPFVQNSYRRSHSFGIPLRSALPERPAVTRPMLRSISMEAAFGPSGFARDL